MAVTFHADGRIDGLSALSLPAGSIIQTVIASAPQGGSSLGLSGSITSPTFLHSDAKVTITPQRSNSKILLTWTAQIRLDPSTYGFCGVFYSANSDMSSPSVIEKYFDFDMSRQSIFGHSMGGHGAIVMALRNPKKFKSCSAFAPIVEPSTASWSSDAFKKYFGLYQSDWQMYDSVALVKNGYHFPEILVDQGDADSFLKEGLRPWLLDDACKDTNINLKLRMHPNYDHSYYFISTFMSDHLIWHRDRI